MKIEQIPVRVFGRLGRVDLEIWKFSPSDEEFDNFLAWVATQMPSAGETRRVAIKRRRNDLSVVVYARVGDDVILLGGSAQARKVGTGFRLSLRDKGYSLV